jgi:serine/threonine protein kinase
LGEHEKIFDLFAWDEVLQEEGDGGKVVVCRPKVEMPFVFSGSSSSSCLSFVMKIRSKETIRENGGQVEEDRFRVAQERMLNFPPHAGVMPLRCALEDDRFYYLVMDKATGGSFFECLLDEFQDGVVPKSALKKIMRDILEALRHLHSQGILHRDIKPDNLVMQADPSDSTARRVTLIDFDHADSDCNWDANSIPQQPAVFGTLRFNAPEAFLAQYSVRSDIYSVGVILYLLMTGKMPYDDEIFDQREIGDRSPATPKMAWNKAIYYQMKKRPIDFECDPWTEQPLCREFCQHLMAFKAPKRMQSADEALSHEWLARPDAT